MSGLTKAARQRLLAGFSRPTPAGPRRTTPPDPRLRAIDRQLVELATGQPWSTLCERMGGEKAVYARLRALRTFARNRGLDESKYLKEVLPKMTRRVLRAGQDAHLL